SRSGGARGRRGARRASRGHLQHRGGDRGLPRDLPPRPRDRDARQRRGGAANAAHGRRLNRMRVDVPTPTRPPIAHDDPATAGRARPRRGWRPQDRRGLRLVAGGALLLLLIELAVRLSGAVDFPLYRVDPAYGYAPLPDQSGSFLRTNRWVFNDQG